MGCGHLELRLYQLLRLEANHLDCLTIDRDQLTVAVTNRLQGLGRPIGGHITVPAGHGLEWTARGY